MDIRLIIGRMIIGSLILVNVLCVAKAEDVAKFTFRVYKKYWGPTERSIPVLTVLCRFWNGLMFFVLCYLFLFLPTYLK